jgi:hypothetical protein
MLRASSFLLCVSVGLVACEPGPELALDGGPDVRCGLDCAAQARYGLFVNRCFEYSSSPTSPEALPALGLWVRDVFTLEGGVKVLPVEYRVRGQTKMVDNFGLRDGDLLLMRRQFSSTGQSVTYRDDGGAIVGVKWLSMDTAGGQTSVTPAQAFTVDGTGHGTTEAVSYQVSTVMGSSSDQRTPLATYGSAITLLFGDEAHGADPRRVYVPDVGFTIVSSSFLLSGSSPLPVALQRVRDLGTPDAGAADCSLGSP